MMKPFFAGLTAFLVSFAFLPFIISFSKKKKIVEVPGGRRIHKSVTPSIGGAAIFSGFTLGCLCWLEGKQWPMSFVLLSVLIIPFIVGLLDDLMDLRPTAKLLAQAITGSLIFFVLQIRITSTYGLIGDQEFPLGVSYMVTLLTVVAITNSLNLIDGIDGLAAMLSLLAAVFFGVWFFSCGIYDFSIICFSLSGAILAFTFYNWEPSRIFMGDTGSLVIGTILSVVVIGFLNENHALETGDKLKFSSSIGTAISVMIIPLIDTCRIIIIRLSKGISPFSADKRHIHHILVEINLTHRQTVYILTLVHILFIGFAVIMREVNDWKVIPAIVTLSIILCVVLGGAHRKHTLRSNGFK